MMKVFISGIGTDVGKTVVSAMLAEAFQADYWKPVQTGPPDTEAFHSLISNREIRIFPAAYTFRLPASPHIAAAAENKKIAISQIKLPETERSLLIEGAGGLLVPLNEQFLIADLIEQLSVPVILVSRAYLGCINHTLLSIKYLQHRGIPLLGIIMCGNAVPAVTEAIVNFGKSPLLAHIAEESVIDKRVILRCAEKLRKEKLLCEIFN